MTPVVNKHTLPRLMWGVGELGAIRLFLVFILVGACSHLLFDVRFPILISSAAHFVIERAIYSKWPDTDRIIWYRFFAFYSRWSLPNGTKPPFHRRTRSKRGKVRYGP